MFGVGHSGIIHGGVQAISADEFIGDFAGLNSIQAQDSLASYPQFANPKRWDGTTAGAGNGDYHLLGTSPLLGLPRDWVLPYDIGGSARTLGDAVGALR